MTTRKEITELLERAVVGMTEKVRLDRLHGFDHLEYDEGRLSGYQRVLWALQGDTSFLEVDEVFAK